MSCQIPPQENHSLNSYVEIIIIDNLYIKNKFEMIKFTTGRTIKDIICQYGISKTYTPYSATPETNKFNLTPIDYSDQIKNKSIYFYINNSIKVERNILEKKLFNLYGLKYTQNKFGSVYFPSEKIRIPFQMPSKRAYV